MSDPRVHEGIRLIRAQEWYEAHEVLEDPWREAEGSHKCFLHALIHAAVSLEHLKLENPRGAWGQWTKAQKKFAQLPPVVDGWEIGAWERGLDALYGQIELEERSRRHVARMSMEGLPEVPGIETWPELGGG
jgi:predicted metal-dependent hydrolase